MVADLHIPEIRVEVDEPDYAKIVAEPLEEGFGTTVGNTLRRVLLSSLPGAAITSVRIDGVDHEFSTVEHMQEDVSELLLNLKEVRLRAFSDRAGRLLLDASGTGEVTAGAIQASADFEVTNPELHLATLQDKNASLSIELNVETGRGYLPATAGEGLPIGVIPVDALFTPVRRVNYHVSHTRVGQDTNFDRLELEVWTDGTVDGRLAVSMAAEIVREQMLGFQRLALPDDAPLQVAEPDDRIEGYDTPIENLGLSVRAYNCLKRSGLTTVGVILERTEEELLALRNFGEKSYLELRDKLEAEGFPTPRSDARRVDDGGGAQAAVAEARPQAPADGAAGGSADGAESDEDVGSLGAALIQALREAGEDSSALADE